MALSIKNIRECSREEGSGWLSVLDGAEQDVDSNCREEDSSWIHYEKL